jgi:Spy/CpxP family protein refolding chaperone
MKGTRWFALAAVAVLAGGVAGARDKRERKAKPKEEGLFDQVARECELGEADRARVKEKVEAYEAAVAAWDRDNAEKVEAAEAAARDAKAKKDADLRKEAGRKLKEVRTEREDAVAEARAAIIEALSPEQKATWEGYLLYKTIAARYRRAELAEEQFARIKAACVVAAKDLGEAGDDGKAKKAVTDKLRWGIDVFVLTPEQREAATSAQAGRKGKRGGDAGGGEAEPE